MRNKYNEFYRTGEISREPNQRVDWLDSLAEKMAVQEQAAKFDAQVKTASKTAVEVSRDRNVGPSVYEMMSSIISGTKPKFSSVEEAVLDYQERTGLGQYLKAQAEEQKAALASVIIQAGEEELTLEEVDTAHAEDCGDADCAGCADASSAEDGSVELSDLVDLFKSNEGPKAEIIELLEPAESPSEIKDEGSLAELIKLFTQQGDLNQPNEGESILIEIPEDASCGDGEVDKDTILSFLKKKL